MSDSPGAALRDLRERKPLIHQITNYVVMNETANVTLAIGALPVMAHAIEEVEDPLRRLGAERRRTDADGIEHDRRSRGVRGLPRQQHRLDPLTRERADVQ